MSEWHFIVTFFFQLKMCRRHNDMNIAAMTGKLCGQLHSFAICCWWNRKKNVETVTLRMLVYTSCWKKNRASEFYEVPGIAKTWAVDLCRPGWAPSFASCLLCDVWQVTLALWSCFAMGEGDDEAGLLNFSFPSCEKQEAGEVSFPLLCPMTRVKHWGAGVRVKGRVKGFSRI